MSIGDITSDQPGSGARYNTGKSPYDLLPLYDIAQAGLITDQRNEPPITDLEVIDLLARWQAGDNTATPARILGDMMAGNGLAALADAARVFEYGRRKYAAWNWAKGMAWSVPLGCAIRHLLDAEAGEHLDLESGLPHRAHAQCNLLMLLSYQRTFPEGDDRPLRHLGITRDPSEQK